MKISTKLCRVLSVDLYCILEINHCTGHLTVVENSKSLLVSHDLGSFI